MLGHMLRQAFAIVQELHVTQLIELVVADDLRAHMRLHVRDVGAACRHCRDARTGEGDLAG